jgi:hypothetical protein
LLKFGNKMPLKKLKNLRLSLRRGPWRFWSWLRGMDLLTLASRCLRTMTGTSIRNWTRNYDDACWHWRDSEGEEEAFVSPDFQCLISSGHPQGLVHCHRYSWTLEMTIQINRLQFKRKFLLLKMLIVYEILYFCKFLVSINIYIFFLRENKLSGTILAIALMDNIFLDLHRFH